MTAGQQQRMVFPKNATEQVEVWRETYRGHELVNARVFYRDASGEWRPTKKGVALPPTLARQVAQAMLAICADDNAKEAADGNEA